MNTSSIVWSVVIIAVVILGGWYFISMSSGAPGTSSPTSTGTTGTGAPGY